MTAKKESGSFYKSFISIIFLLLFWQLLSWLLKLPALPGPVPSLQTFFSEIPDNLWSHFFISTYRVAISLLISLVLAIPLGMLLGREEKYDRYVWPLVYLVYPVPKIVFLPVLMALLGLKDLSKISLIVMVVFFQILVTTRDSARSINKELIHSVISLGASKWDLYKHVVWPAVIPEVLTSLRIASGTAIAVLFFAETVASQEGLGYYLLDAWSRAAYPEMFAGIISMGLLGYVIYNGIDILEKRACRWK